MKEIEKLIADLTEGKCSVGKIKTVKFFVDGAYRSEPSLSEKSDNKLEIYGDKEACFADISAGKAFTLPITECAVDYSIAKYHTKFAFGDCILTYSSEDSNPYLDRPHSWFIYGEEWLTRRLNQADLYKNCRIRLLQKPKHLLTKEEPYADLDMKKGYDVYRFSAVVEDIAYPYYEIAAIRKVGDEKNFALFVMKSQTSRTSVMDGIVESYAQFAPKGERKLYFKAPKPTGDPRWSAETKAYFDQLCNQHTTSWGVFSYSMPGLEGDLTDKSETYREFFRKSVEMEEAIEKAWGKKYDIYPTYTHIGKGKDADDFDGHHFPSQMAEALAGGNGFNGKPVLQFTYQFTLNNNLVDENQTPMYDILRGKFDEHFRRLARDIRDYKKPVLFRLNNEMNTDWTSYCGMITMLDPDIFNETWQRLYDIFIEEGVDNCIWIWNPVANSCPYSSWGEDLCYFPGVDYVQLLGGTSYEMNNYAKEEAAEKLVSFEKHYERLFQKNNMTFEGWSMILSEFACGAGGNFTGELDRNVGVQAKWVEDMFSHLNAEPKSAWADQIKGAIWFNCDDRVGDKVSNRLRFVDPGKFANEPTLEAFRKGFAKK